MPDTMPVDPMEFRRALGCFATGVTVITALDEAGDHTIFIGNVQHVEHAAGKPLLFFRGNYAALPEAAPV